jgi:hypothetical protein
MSYDIEPSLPAHAGTKRKFELNHEERQRALEKERAEAIRKINEAKAEEAKPKLPSFWLVCIGYNIWPYIFPSNQTL